jgi:hypothetical protein
MATRRTNGESYWPIRIKIRSPTMMCKGAKV